MALVTIDAMTRSELLSDEHISCPPLQMQQRPFSLIDSELINMGAECGTKAAAIKLGVKLLHAQGRIENSRELEQALLQREALSSTGIGYGFAVPHCKSSSVLANSLAVLKLSAPVDWESLDHHPVNIVILMVIREADQTSGHLKILSQIARNLMDETFRARLAAENDPVVLCAFLKTSLNA